MLARRLEVLVVKSGEEIDLHLGQPILISKLGTEERGYRQRAFAVIDHRHFSIFFDGEHYPVSFRAKIDAIVLRASEILALRWSDILWEEERIRVCKRWAKGEDGKTKTDASDAYVPMHPMLAGHLSAWHGQTPYAKEADSVFPSFRARGRVPLSASIFVADHLRPAARKAGVQVEDGQRFGFHNLRHSLSNWLVNKAKIEPKTVQGILRHSKIQTTLDLYTQEDGDETRAAQRKYLTALRAATRVLQ